jgi:membrane protease YdiL (CAAX protease family)
LAAFGPFAAAVLTIRATKGSTGLCQWLQKIFRLRIPIFLYLSGALFLPLGVAVLHYGIYLMLGGQSDFSTVIPWYQYLAYLIPTALLTGGNEEPGWRSFALPALLERFHPLTATLILGFVHSVWHLPMMARYETTFVLYLYNLIPLTVIFNWFYLVSRGSVVPVMLFHAGTNVVGSFVPTPMVVFGRLGTYMALRGTVYWGMAIVLLIATKGRLGYYRQEER